MSTLPSGTSNHFDDSGQARMVDVSAKTPTVRLATARGTVTMMAATADLIRRGTAAKGDVLAVARLAAIGATKLTSQLIPLCHAIPVESVQVEFADVTASEPPSDASRASWQCSVTVKTTAKTGVEMEAMTATAVACLTIYDMVKGIDRAVTIGPLELVHKSGGKSGTFQREIDVQT